MKLPVTRGDCKDGPRPCPHACRYRLEGAESCALDVADRGGGLSRPDVAALMGVSKARIQDLEELAMRKVCDALGVPVPAYADYGLEVQLNVSHHEERARKRDEETAGYLRENGRSTNAQIAKAMNVNPQVVRESLLRLLGEDRVTRSKVTRVEFGYQLLDEAEAAE